MKLFVIIACLSIAYLCGMVVLIKELRAKTSKEERQENQTIPIMCTATTAFVAIAILVVRLANIGVIS